MRSKNNPVVTEIDIGINTRDRKQIVQGLSALLADSYTLYLMTHNFHWNVTGPQFNSLHLMFMGQYTEQWEALDLIAERIRALGYPAPGTYKEFAKLTSISEVEGNPEAMDIWLPPRRPRREPHENCCRLWISFEISQLQTC
jgi:starvation-inducible DNA-binding protein